MKSFIVAGMLTASLAFAANSAMAASPANPIPNGLQDSYARPAAHVASRTPRVGGQLNADIGQFIQGMLAGGPVPYANLVRDVRNLPASSGTDDYSPIYDPAPAAGPIGCASCDAQAASDEEVQEIQQMNDTMALTASMAAAEQENDAANAAALQTEINAGM